MFARTKKVERSSKGSYVNISKTVRFILPKRRFVIFIRIKSNSYPFIYVK